MNAGYYPDSESERILKIGHTVQKLWLFFENPLLIAQRPCQGGAIDHVFRDFSVIFHRIKLKLGMIKDID